MQSPEYYREKAETARRLAAASGDHELHHLLRCVERDYDDIAIDLEDGAIELIHPELMPPDRHR